MKHSETVLTFSATNPPPGGTVLDPFTGSGSTGKAAILEGFTFIGCEMTEDYLPIIQGRLEHAEATAAAEKEKQDEALF
jgi:site-specific DNA-methyltransferase (adenine-specific)